MNVNKSIDLVKSHPVSIEIRFPYSFILAIDNHLHDMKNQLRANEQRLDLLQKENESLKLSLEKLSLSNRPPIVTEEPRNQSYLHTTEIVRPPLWLLNNEILEQQAFTESRYDEF